MGCLSTSNAFMSTNKYHPVVLGEDQRAAMHNRILFFRQHLYAHNSTLYAHNSTLYAHNSPFNNQPHTIMHC